MADPGGGVLAPKLELLTVKERPTNLSFPDMESRSQHPFSPWGPITKFYVKFTVHPVRQSIFPSQGRSEFCSFPVVHTGLVLARAYQGRANLCIWSGQIFDALLNVAGIDAQIAKSVSTALHDCIYDMPMHKEIVGIEVDIRVISPVVVNANSGIFA